VQAQGRDADRRRVPLERRVGLMRVTRYERQNSGGDGCDDTATRRDVAVECARVLEAAAGERAVPSLR
jgi:hypothetical protein